MLLIIFSIVAVLSILSGIFVLAALMLSSEHSASEPWLEYHPAPAKAEPIAVPVRSVRLNSHHR